MSKFGWCFIGAGNIARMVADDSEGINIVSVCAGHFENAQNFALKYGATAYKTVEEAVSAPGVDCVYVATQHPEHFPSVLTALRAGKNVLCEKPIGINAKQVKIMIDEAGKADKFLAEAMWPRHNPILKTVKSWIEKGEIGDVRYLHADFAEFVPDSDKSRVHKKDRAGGALLDMGIYPLAIAQFIYGGAPEEIQSFSALSDEAIDLSISALLRYPQGKIASVYTSIEAHSTYTLTIHGQKGEITVPSYWRAREAVLTRLGGETMRTERGGCKGYGYQTRAIEEQITAGLKECPQMPLSDSYQLALTMDELRRQAGVVYQWD